MLMGNIDILLYFTLDNNMFKNNNENHVTVDDKKVKCNISLCKIFDIFEHVVVLI